MGSNRKVIELKAKIALQKLKKQSFSLRPFLNILKPILQWMLKEKLKRVNSKENTFSVFVVDGERERVGGRYVHLYEQICGTRA